MYQVKYGCNIIYKRLNITACLEKSHIVLYSDSLWVWHAAVFIVLSILVYTWPLN